MRGVSTIPEKTKEVNYLIANNLFYASSFSVGKCTARSNISYQTGLSPTPACFKVRTLRPSKKSYPKDTLQLAEKLNLKLKIPFHQPYIRFTILKFRMILPCRKISAISRIDQKRNNGMSETGNCHILIRVVR